MAVYYVDFNEAVCENGYTPESPKNSLGFEQAGDVVLFRRGGYYRTGFSAVKGVYYGAYGEGTDPVFSGSVNLCKPEYWKETEPHIWRCLYEIATEACSLVFDFGVSCGTLRWDKNELKENGDWYDSRFGEGEAGGTATQELLLYSPTNPALSYTDIECVLRVERQLCTLADDITLEHLTFLNHGVHGVAGPQGARGVRILNCTFRYIGGAVWSRERKIRFGNGVEFWDRASDILVSECDFREIYDSCVTHQGGEQCEIPRNISFCGNRFSDYGMAAYECRDRMPAGGLFSGNLCRNAGCGFAMQGEERPRRSEIWPQPMGHHIFLWRIDVANEEGRLLVCNNQFEAAPEGAAVYSIILPEAEQQMSLFENTYTGSMLMKQKLANGREAV